MSGFRTKFRRYKANLRYPFGKFLGWFGFLVGIVSGLLQIAGAFNLADSTKDSINALSLSIIAITSFALLGYREYQRDASLRLGECVPDIEKISVTMRDLRSYLNQQFKERRHTVSTSQVSIAASRKMISEILTQTADMYSGLTRTNCRCCIKLIDGPPSSDGSKPKPEDLFVFALSRDEKSQSVCRYSDAERSDNRLDRLADNSDFLGLWDESKGDNGYFLSNDLEKEPNYESSSIHYWRGQGRTSFRAREKKWSLPYKSAIVWPIRQERRPDLGINEYRCLGFLAVDSASTYAFSEDHHVQVGTVLANAFFPVLEIFTEIQKK